MSMFIDYDEMEFMRERITRERPERFFNKDGEEYGTVHYGEEYGKEYADIGWILPAGCCVVLEDHGNNPELGVPVAVRFWL
jgi:hypothetical protein